MILDQDLAVIFAMDWRPIGSTGLPPALPLLSPGVRFLPSSRRSQRPPVDGRGRTPALGREMENSCCPSLAYLPILRQVQLGAIWSFDLISFWSVNY